jgi:helicase MOV-10
MKEVDQVKFHLDQISKTIASQCPETVNYLNDIGIITPYRKQKMKLKVACESYIDLNIEIGTIEQFQGREKNVIILSTVRSNTSNVGFLDNPKRFNVAITRAKFLLIIVGNPKTLRQDANWGEMVKYCETNRSRVTSYDLKGSSMLY